MERARDFYDELAADYHMLFGDWDASMRRQGAGLAGILGDEVAEVLDCACGIGTQAVGLALAGYRVIATDISPAAVRRAADEADARGAPLRCGVADMRRLPFVADRFDAVVCADNSIAHLLDRAEALTAFGQMTRVLRDGGTLVLSLRDHAETRRHRPASTPPQVSTGAHGRTITFQLWHWHPDGEHYDMEHFQLHERDGDRTVRVRCTTLWAPTVEQVAGLLAEAGCAAIRRRDPADTGFFQPVITARKG